MQHIPQVNVNPFLAPKQAGGVGRRGRGRRAPLRLGNGAAVSHYLRNFQEVSKVGSGQFADVFRCVSRVDGVTYAVKRPRQGGLASSVSAMLREAQAMAALASCSHVLQYFSAWREDATVYIQTDLAWGSLTDAVEMSSRVQSQAMERQGEGGRGGRLGAGAG